ncbi:methionyl-tRNA formyltransferase [Mariprofundus ferrinatatus]|uniref:Methionyl-tRNA formyltransferase n=1 Tax=Mariprofundus ferrinatatus TaxID=1921087 RepID=A0A2K8LE40_9PROT|nr:methionyl-tRNA formyltransferase [Mariprofundus ferrinatatus]ATX82546.1 methionyl-tRNA formyltransferase [Mariprofundus ferrinatatus]
MRIVFAGTPGFSVPCLEALIEADGVEVVGVVSQPDRKAGRGMKLTPSAVKQAAMDAGIDVITPDRLRDNSEALEWLRDKAPDFLVVVAFGMILPRPWLDAASIAPLNVHASLLPRWRGAAPIERSLLAGDPETGVCIMQMEEGLDTGGVYGCRKLPISETTTGSDLWFALAPLGAELLIEMLPKIAAGLKPEPQPDAGVTYAAKISNEERIIDWSKPAAEIDRLVRCFSPRPGVRTQLAGKWLKLIAGSVVTGAHNMLPGQIVKVEGGLDIACGDKSLYRIRELQPEGKKAMAAVDFLRGAQLQKGDSLS